MMNGTPATSPGSPGPGLTPSGLLASDLWLDQPDAAAEVERRLSAGVISEEQARGLRQYLAQGYLIFKPAIDPAVFDRLEEDLQRLWSEQPHYMAFALHSLLTRFSGNDQEKRKPSCRIVDLHGFSQAAMTLYLQREIHAWVALILGEPIVATQSLFFEWGSQQALHRDPIHVQMERPSHLLAAWVACEDISPGSGPLVYVPGSHGQPYYQFEPGRFVFDHGKDGQAGILAAEAWDREHCEKAGLKLEAFTPKRGEVLIWHHSLLHGGSFPTTPGLTRKSFVVHFTTRAHKQVLPNTYIDPYASRLRGDASPSPFVYSTKSLLGSDGALGFESPLREHCLAEPPGLYSQLFDLQSVDMSAQLEKAAAAQREAVAQRDHLAGQIEWMRQSRFWRLRDQWFGLKRTLGLSRES